MIDKVHVMDVQNINKVYLVTYQNGSVELLKDYEYALKFGMVQND